MKQISRISGLSGFASRSLGLYSLVFLLGIPVICLALLGAFGLAAYPLLGASAWEPALNFTAGLADSLSVAPALIGVAGLVMLAILCPATACFGHWCLSQGAARPAGFRLPPLVRRLVALASPLWASPNRAARPCFVWAGAPPHLSSTRRTAAPTAAGLSGAAPLLE